MDTIRTQEESDQVLEDMVRLVAPLLEVLSGNDNSNEKFAIFLVVMNTSFGFILNRDLAKEDYGDVLMKYYREFYENKATYEFKTAAGRLSIALTEGEKVKLMNVFLEMSRNNLRRVEDGGSFKYWKVHRQNLDENDNKNYNTEKIVASYCDELGLIWDIERNEFFNNAWAHPKQNNEPYQHKADPVPLINPPKQEHLFKKVTKILEGLQPDTSLIRESNKTDDPRIVVVYTDDPADAGIRFSIAFSVIRLVESDLLEYFGCEGSNTEIDTSLVWDYPQEVIKQFVKDLKISAAEFAHISLRGKFYCKGVEDKMLYQQALELFRKGDDFGVNQLGSRRAHAMIRNLLDCMSEKNFRTAAINGCGNLPPFLCTELKKQSVSYILVEPVSGGEKDWERFVKIMDDQR